jgi:peptide/nickel transport system substrate-binding protein
MKKIRWQLLIIFIAGLIVGVLLLSEQPSATNPENTTIQQTPVPGGAYTEVLIGSMQRLNPVLDFYNSVDRDIDRLLYQSLVRFDSRGLPHGDLAESWDISQDGTVYNFSLRQGATWHDGEPVTAEDILFTVQLLRNGGSIVPADLQAFWMDIEVKVLDANNLQFRLPEPFAPFLDYLTFGILPRHILDGLTIEEIVDHDFNFAPIGSGPFMFDHLIIEDGQIQGVALKAFDKYLPQAAFIQEIAFRYYPDAQSAWAAYQADEVQGIGYVPAEILSNVLTDPNMSLYTGRLPQIGMIFLNLKSPEVKFLEDADIRRALLLALDRQALIDNALQGHATIADGPILPDTWAYYAGTPRIEYDPVAAESLLKEAGYVFAAEGATVRSKSDVYLKFTLLYPDTETHRLLAEAIQKDWAAIGVQADLEAVPYDQLVNDRLAQRTYQAALVDLNLSRSPDPDPYPFWDQAQATGGQNYSQWDDRMVSEYLEQARVTEDLAERTRLYNNFQVIFSQQLPSLPLFFPMYSYAVTKDVKGVGMGPLFDNSDRFATIMDWYFTARVRTKVTP